MFADAALSFSGDDALLGLNPNTFHTFRFQSTQGLTYRVTVDGQILIDDSDNELGNISYIQFGGLGSCLPDPPNDTVNQWDFVRYGTIGYDERIVSSDPPAGLVHARQHPSIDRFTVRYDSPNYVYLDEISVEVTSGSTPIPIQTRRLDNGPPDVVEIVLDRAIPFNATTTFTFNDGKLSQSLEFTYAPGDTDGDGLATLSDLAAFQNCFGSEPLSGLCPVLDFDADGDIDLLDFAEFQNLFGAP